MKRLVYDALFLDSRAGVIVSRVITGLILLNVTTSMLETVDSLYLAFGPVFRLVEYVSLSIFTLEYALRLWSCTVDPRYRHSIIGRLGYALTPYAIIDLLAIAPFYLPVKIDLRVLRALRLLRLAKIGRYSQSLQLIRQVFLQSKDALTLSLSALIVILIVSSSLLFYAEHDAQPEVFSSIPAALWWGVATLTTVGYGDIYPVTPVGKILSAVIAVLSIGIFALPTGILSAGFLDAITKQRKRDELICPRCGYEHE